MDTRKTLAADFDAFRINWPTYRLRLVALELSAAELGEPAWLAALHGVSS